MSENRFQAVVAKNRPSQGLMVRGYEPRRRVSRRSWKRFGRSPPPRSTF